MSEFGGDAPGQPGKIWPIRPGHRQKRQLSRLKAAWGDSPRGASSGQRLRQCLKSPPHYYVDGHTDAVALCGVHSTPTPRGVAKVEFPGRRLMSQGPPKPSTSLRPGALLRKKNPQLAFWGVPTGRARNFQICTDGTLRSSERRPEAPLAELGFPHHRPAHSMVLRAPLNAAQW